MKQHIIASTKILSQKVSFLLLTPVFILGFLIAPVGSFGTFGTQIASAADPAGDWYTQYERTKSAAYDSCFWQARNQPSIGSCVGVLYLTSNSYGDHSRYFNYNIYWQNLGCQVTYYIGNSYYIFNTVYYTCWWR